MNGYVLYICIWDLQTSNKTSAFNDCLCCLIQGIKSSIHTTKHLLKARYQTQQQRRERSTERNFIRRSSFLSVFILHIFGRQRCRFTGSHCPFLRTPRGVPSGLKRTLNTHETRLQSL